MPTIPQIFKVLVNDQGDLVENRDDLGTVEIIKVLKTTTEVSNTFPLNIYHLKLDNVEYIYYSDVLHNLGVVINIADGIDEVSGEEAKHVVMENKLVRMVNYSDNFYFNSYLNWVVATGLVYDTELFTKALFYKQITNLDMLFHLVLIPVAVNESLYSESTFKLGVRLFRDHSDWEEDEISYSLYQSLFTLTLT